ncbi:hypothetical protein SAMN05216599_103250 [Pseudomonas cichorii]|nr:DUF6515 family protein [Pseudomonas cichorii]SDN76948.1 hypothetical protein SAMN05216599_103250 [Pseudomonas cichorii]
MKSGIWKLTGLSLLCLSISAHAVADDDSFKDQYRGSSGDNGQQRRIQQQQQNQQFQVERQQQQQIQQQQNQQRQVERQQQQQIYQQQQNQQRQIQDQLQQQRNVERQQQQQIYQQQQNQQRQIQDQQNQQRQIERQQFQQHQNNLPIQTAPRESWQTQQPRQGYYQDNPRGNRNWSAGNGRPNDRWEGRPDGRGNGWGPGPQYRPGYTIDRVPGGYSRIPYRGQDYFYSQGYWYRPQGPRYVVVTPPYGLRVRSLPSYSQEIWIGSSLLFLAAGTYYAYQSDSQDYVVVNPPQNQPTYSQAPAQNGYDPVSYPLNGQSPEQVELDRYQCYRWAVEQSGFDPANITSQPQAEVVDLYRRSMGACLAGRGYSVN